MIRISSLDPAQATGKTKELFNTAEAKMGQVPNLLRSMGHSPATLAGYLNFSGALDTGNLNANQREQVALIVAEVNLCRYCLSAHSFVGSKLGLSDKEINDARQANAADNATDADLEAARNGGDILTNYVNHVAHTTIDFPEVKSDAVECAPAN